MSACHLTAINTALLVLLLALVLSPLVAFAWWLRRVSRQAEWNPPNGGERG